uniref:Uncharacterized protein n=1 Tax=Rhizophora mucronata TaxID=61149 RepID=A0A2P2PT53_RHIMU
MWIKKIVIFAEPWEVRCDRQRRRRGK